MMDSIPLFSYSLLHYVFDPLSFHIGFLYLVIYLCIMYLFFYIIFQLYLIVLKIINLLDE